MATIVLLLLKCQWYVIKGRGGLGFFVNIVFKVFFYNVCVSSKIAWKHIFNRNNLSSFMIYHRFVTLLLRRVPLVEQELLTLLEHTRYPPFLSGVRVVQYLVPFTLMLIVITLTRLRWKLCWNERGIAQRGNDSWLWWPWQWQLTMAMAVDYGKVCRLWMGWRIDFCREYIWYTHFLIYKEMFNEQKSAGIFKQDNLYCPRQVFRIILWHYHPSRATYPWCCLWFTCF